MFVYVSVYVCVYVSVFGAIHRKGPACWLCDWVGLFLVLFFLLGPNYIKVHFVCNQVFCIV